MSSMSKTELVAAVAGATGTSKAAVEELLTATLQVIREETAAGRTIRLPGFGQFAVKERAARTARNPQTGVLIDVPARKVLAFKPSKTAA